MPRSEEIINKGRFPEMTPVEEAFADALNEIYSMLYSLYLMHC